MASQTSSLFVYVMMMDKNQIQTKTPHFHSKILLVNSLQMFYFAKFCVRLFLYPIHTEFHRSPIQAFHKKVGNLKLLRLVIKRRQLTTAYTEVLHNSWRRSLTKHYDAT